MSGEAELYTGTDPEGREYLVTRWPDDSMEVATRTPAHPSVTWSPPVALTLVLPRWNEGASA